ncbi:glycosyltransferase family 39 protein [Listeria cossartiae subsp. cayugensis]|uniref:ArnT family glycosyltransferase n=1 Tax=Listeria cossartiae TaxID=2838249 RepID=UPI0028801073|nr:glycosyltransferase family 39 protein [Listeria cossartiae]MDS9999358.1 glycosyltransferase family 39 protein [Listeria cossartiae subsp. cayugensis]MDT0008195.1 glycosyltransferase family 39 protein [Listeria cossartiae subsp. cayugensis]MDT0029390.1 glycosyltransferase family 39 protein [Listeria cossartiae subsp. cayugensis]MDT0037505.1 glycosyltransferase family 39 protein [Listeria cossartiae subsp. cayugensis]MDT0042855.1 glycosyltransferase family 39 protein [Listeria cossartiae subs
MKKWIQPWDFYFVGIIVIAIFFNFYGIWNDDTVNPYYTAAVTSMVQNFHNFFYGAFDPAGFITVDKPPVALWLQAISALIFGVHGWSVILPQALAGVGSVILLYVLVKPRFGAWAARITALIMALTPIAVAVTRTNNMDAILVFILLLATYFLFKAVNRAKFGWLLLAFGLIGVGFNVKMLQAFMVVPAFLLFYFIAVKLSWRKKLIQLVIALILMLGVSVSWAVVVDQTAASERPYVGSSQTNSVLELAFGYNGMERLLGQETGTGSSASNMEIGGPPSNNSTDSSNATPPTPPSGNMQGGADGGGTPPQGNNGTPPTGGPGNTTNGGTGSKMTGSTGMFGTGNAGPLRLFQTALGDQISWFLPLAIIGMLAIFLAYRNENKRIYQLNSKQKEMVFWAVWLIPVAGFFSVAGFFHHYYLIMLAPPIAVLSGAGLVALFRLYRHKDNWQKFLLPTTLTLTGALQAFFVASYLPILAAVIGIAALAVSIALIAIRQSHTKLAAKITAVALAILLTAPTYWSLTPLLYGGNSSLPEAGPQLKQSSGGGFADASVDSGLISYLQKNNTGETYLFGTTDATTAGPYIIKTKEAVMALGGFNGTDPTLTVKQLKQMIKSGEIKYFYLPSNSKASDSDVVKWIQENGTEIDQSEWSSSTSTDDDTTSSASQNTNGGAPGMNGSGEGTLYQLK